MDTGGKSERVLCAALGLLLGLAISALPGIKLEASITFGNILTCITTLGVAWIVSYFLKNRQTEADALYGHAIKRVEKALDVTEVVIQRALVLLPGDWDEAAYQTDIVQKLREVANFLHEADLLCSTKKGSSLKDAQKAYFSLKAKLTDYSPTKKPITEGLRDIEVAYSCFRTTCLSSLRQLCKR